MKAGACSEEGDPNLTLTAKAWARGRLSVMTRVPLVQSLLWKRLRPRGTGLRGAAQLGGPQAPSSPGSALGLRKPGTHTGQQHLHLTCYSPFACCFPCPVTQRMRTEPSPGVSWPRAGHTRRRTRHWHSQCVLNTAARPAPAPVLIETDRTSILQMNKLRPRDIK